MCPDAATGDGADYGLGGGSRGRGDRFRPGGVLRFRRIYILQHHQGPDGLESLCLKRAAGEVVRETVHKWGTGWGRTEDHPTPNIFGWIQVAYVDSFSTYASAEAERIPIGHAGRGETQLIQAAHGDTVRMAALATLDPLSRWLEDADEADADEGARRLEFCVQGWVTELSR